MINNKKHILDRSDAPDTKIVFDYDNCEKQLKKIDDLLTELDSMITIKYDALEYKIPEAAWSNSGLNDNRGIVGELEHILRHMPAGPIPGKHAA